MPDKPLIDLKKLQEYSQSPPGEWMIQNADGTKYGPFGWKDLEQFAAQRRIVETSKIMHPVKTKGAWISPSKAPALWKIIQEQQGKPPIESSSADVNLVEIAEYSKSVLHKERVRSNIKRSAVFGCIVLIISVAITYWWRSTSIPVAISAKFYSGNGAISTYVDTKNQTLSPLEWVKFRIEVMKDNRPIPLFQKVQSVRVRGGINPGETIPVDVHVSPTVFPNDPHDALNEEQGKWLKVSVVGYVDANGTEIEITRPQWCKGVFFDAYDDPQKNIGESDSSASATNPLEYSMRETMGGGQRK